jgi:hypothetical protein
MNIEKKIPKRTINIPLITHDFIVKKYNVNFYKYLKNLILIKELLVKKLKLYKKQKKEYINNLKTFERIKFRIDQSKTFSITKLKFSQHYSKIKELSLHIKLMEQLIEMLWTSPLYTHTIHYTLNKINDPRKGKEKNLINDFENKSIDSIFLLYITHFEINNDFTFKESEILDGLEKIRDSMGTMWLYFKEKHYNFALKKLNELSTLMINDNNYNNIVNDYIDNLVPIFSIFEIFNRSLSESVYPESIPQTKRFGAYLASFLTSRFNPFGVSLMNLFNKLAFYNWSYFISKRKLDRKGFFNTIYRLPIWKYIPQDVTNKILEPKF